MSASSGTAEQKRELLPIDYVCTWHDSSACRDHSAILSTFPARLIAIITFAVCLMSPISFADDAYDLSGEWYFEVLTSPNGPGKRDVLFRQDGQRVIGFIESSSASGRFVGNFDGRQLTFTAVLEFGGLPFGADYKATVDGDSMRGSIDFGDYGTATFVGYRGRAPDPAASVNAEVEGLVVANSIDAAVLDERFGVSNDGLLVPEMLTVSAGRFVMGSRKAGEALPFGDDFAHLHEVEISAFLMSRFLITNAQYLTFCEATGREPPKSPRGWGDYLRRMPNHPVVNVSYNDAEAYANWLSKITDRKFQLPTEAEWEFAARAGTTDGRLYLWGDEWDIDAANTSTWHIGQVVDRDAWKTWWDSEGQVMAKSRPMTTRVGSFEPNGWGFYDMTGNVWEWMRDWYEADYYARSPAKDPQGPLSGDEKVLRGCSWYNKPDVCFISTRDRYALDLRLYYNGFRVVAENGP